MKRRTIIAVTAALALVVSIGGYILLCQGVRVPVLMYHHLTEETGGEYTVSREKFQHQMDLLEQQGYHPVSLQQMVDYVNGVGDLPDNPVCITFDDGYESNYQIAYPILLEKEFPAAVFIIGSMVGCSTFYRETQIPILPYLTAEELQQMRDSGLITIQSHTYDMHQIADGESGDETRLNLEPLDGESEEHYAAAVKGDLEQEQALFQKIGLGEIWAVSYPNGVHNDTTDRTMKKLGIQMTFTTKSNARNRLVRGKSGSLHELGRLNINDNTTDEALLRYLEEN